MLPGRDAVETRMRQMVNLNFAWFMQTLLDRKDRMSMYSGLEVRVPFCDYRIAEYLYAVPWDFKDYQGQELSLIHIFPPTKRTSSASSPWALRRSTMWT